MPRYNFAFGKLLDGRIIVAGGAGTGAGPGSDPQVSLSSVEIFDPTTNVWTVVAPMLVSRQQMIGWAVLPDGRFLVCGGYDEITDSIRNTAEIYDPIGNAWSFTGTPMQEGRGNALQINGSLEPFNCAAVIPSGPNAGNVIVWGGEYFDAMTSLTLSQTSEIYDVAGNSWVTVPLATMPFFLDATASAFLADNRLMIAAGCGQNQYNPGSPTAYTALWDPAANTWTAIAILPDTRRQGMSLTLLTAGPNAGQVLMVGGFDRGNNPRMFPACWLYDPGSDTWAAGPALNVARFDCAVGRMTDGRLAVIGGAVIPSNYSSWQQPNLSSMEILDEVAMTWALGPAKFADAYLQAFVQVPTILGLSTQGMVIGGAVDPHWRGDPASVEDVEAMGCSPYLPAPPIVSSYTPEFASPGDPIVIHGQNFSAFGNANAVTINGNPMDSFTVDSDTQISAVLPAAGFTADVIDVTTPIATGTGPIFYRTVVVTSYSQNIAGPSAAIFVNGSGFTGVSAVTVGGTPAPGIFPISDTQFQITAPTAWTSGPICATAGPPANTGCGPVLVFVSWQSVPAMSIPIGGRANFAFGTLASGNPIISGGDDGAVAVLRTTELDLATESWIARADTIAASPSGANADGRQGIVLADGRFLCSSRVSGDFGIIYTPISDSWANNAGATGGVPFVGQNDDCLAGKFYAAALATGTRVIFTGPNQSPPGNGTANVYDPITDVNTNVGGLAAYHALDAAIGQFASDSSVMLTGGTSNPLHASIFDGTTGGQVFPPLANMPSGRVQHRMILITAGADAGKMLIVGGRVNSVGAPLATTLLYDRGADTWAPGPTMLTGRVDLVLARDSTGVIVAAGGDAFSTCEILDETTMTWIQIASLPYNSAGAGFAVIASFGGTPARLVIFGGYEDGPTESVVTAKVAVLR